MQVLMVLRPSTPQFIPYEVAGVSISFNSSGTNVSQSYHALDDYQSMPSDFCRSMACSFLLLSAQMLACHLMLFYGSQCSAGVAMMQDALAKDSYVHEIVNVGIDGRHSCSLLAQGHQYKPHCSRINVVLLRCDTWSWGSSMPSRWACILILDKIE